MALISISIQTLMLKLSPSGPWLWESNIPLFVGAGYVVPALIAHDMGRQGIKRTTKAVLLAGVIVPLPIALALLLQLQGVNDLAPLAGFGTMSIAAAGSRWPCCCRRQHRGVSPTTTTSRPAASSAPRTSACSWAIRTRWRWRSPSPCVTFVLVRYVLMNVLILFGRRKFSAMLLTSSMLSWTLLWVGPSFFSAARHQPPRPGIDGPDAAVRARPAGQRHGPHQPAPGRGRCRARRRVRRADDVVDPVDRRRCERSSCRGSCWPLSTFVDHLLEVDAPAVPPLPPGQGGRRGRQRPTASLRPTQRGRRASSNSCRCRTPLVDRSPPTFERGVRAEFAARRAGSVVSAGRPTARRRGAHWPHVERRKAGRPWSNRPASAVSCPTTSPSSTWSAWCRTSTRSTRRVEPEGQQALAGRPPGCLGGR